MPVLSGADCNVCQFILLEKASKQLVETLPLVFLDNFVVDTGIFSLAENLSLFIHRNNSLFGAIK